MFTEHANKLVEVANLACSMSANEDGVQIQNLCPHVINAARVLASRAVDDILTVNDFLAVSEDHILEDVNKCCLALQEGDSETLDCIAGTIRGR